MELNLGFKGEDTLLSPSDEIKINNRLKEIGVEDSSIRNDTIRFIQELFIRNFEDISRIPHLEERLKEEVEEVSNLKSIINEKDNEIRKYQQRK